MSVRFTLPCQWLGLMLLAVCALPGSDVRSQCDTPAIVYINTDDVIDLDGEPILQLQITTMGGSQLFTFAEGTAQHDLIAALNAFNQTLRISAAVSDANPQRVRVSTSNAGSEQSMTIAQLAPNSQPRLHHGPSTAKPLMLIDANGSDGVFGDLDCDGLVGLADVLLLVNAWGPCKSRDVCHGDLNGDGVVDTKDLILLLEAWNA